MCARYLAVIILSLNCCYINTFTNVYPIDYANDDEGDDYGVNVAHIGDGNMMIVALFVSMYLHFV